MPGEGDCGAASGSKLAERLGHPSQGGTVRPCDAPKQGMNAMSYLLVKLLVYLLGALLIGLIVGWISCSREHE
jgi:hypothetical protein